MKKIPVSKLVPVHIMFVILFIDAAVIAKDFICHNTATAVILIVLGAILGYRGVSTLIALIKEYK